MVASWKITAAALLLFGTGILTGIFLRDGLLQPIPTAPIPSSLPSPSPTPTPTNSPRLRIATRPPGWQRLEAIRRIESEVQLSESQRRTIHEMIRASEERIRSEWDPVLPRLQAEVRDLRRRISSELTPEQRQRFDALLDRRDPNASARPPRRTNSSPSVR